ncbi:hypothetical protein FPSE_09338 [Fusarium pseudograminearum CS3096]|uniref:Uncharacterized protein n=1 Tax=Fusarium pseudograminearum (strain CS3096) TaxID=1028729 RepID=K3V9S5_FUSPC|nr:hypothetical protein FPSE_09338 [Fusarium pseudograminearum CS3096]EKJ70477.1 hypothetical protein FPSE_09338 [Fusarium pseudograminearum CS3096]
MYLGLSIFRTSTLYRLPPKKKLKELNKQTMPTTSGTVSSFDGGNKITATFVVDGVQCTFNGSFDPPVGDFNSYDAKLDYSDIRQLTTQREFRGKVSSQNLIIDTNNGPKITSHSDKPISPVSQFSGRGSWEHS